MRYCLRALVLVLVGVLAGSAVPADASAQASPTDTAGILAQPITGRALQCENGRIKIFDCQNIELLSYLPADLIDGGGGATLGGGPTRPPAGNS